uniref:Uncharacterized protein n=1 Tax=Pyxicephalus adspersus TaxID=30357 RepID=A0AAV2ZV04_PYXAD|nr:TPA: hypothetical protein GDO54_003301 [Pyxicephalus adspersus]
MCHLESLPHSGDRSSHTYILKGRYVHESKLLGQVNKQNKVLTTLFYTYKQVVISSNSLFSHNDVPHLYASAKNNQEVCTASSTSQSR